MASSRMGIFISVAHIHPNYILRFFPFPLRIVRYEAQTSCKELAIVFNDLHKIQLVAGPEETCHMIGLATSLRALNLAEAANGRINSVQMIDIYVGVALRIKASLPSFLHVIQRYYLGLAKLASANSCDPIPPRLQWLFTPYGYKFFIPHKFSQDVKSRGLPFSSIGNSIDPLAIKMKVNNTELPKRVVFSNCTFRYIANTYWRRHCRFSLHPARRMTRRKRI